MASKNVVIVTGANRGIGRAICELILARHAGTNPPLVLYATSRKGAELGLVKTSSNQTIKYQALDISKPESIEAMVRTLQSERHTPVNVLINNAGVNLDGNFTPANAKRTLDVNYRGTLHMSQAIASVIAHDGRIVNLSSVASSLRPFGPQLARRFRDISSLEELEELMHEYENAVEGGHEDRAGFPSHRAYSVSKAAMNSMTATMARTNAENGIKINCCCPGWVDTDMGSQVGHAPKTPLEGAKIPVRLAFDDIGGVSGRYWANDNIRSSQEGKVQEW